jgi:hypothetical protein
MAWRHPHRKRQKHDWSLWSGFYFKVSALWNLFLEMVKPAPQTGVVKGKLLYGDPALLEGVLVTLIQDGITVASALTAADGSFALDAMAVGTYLLTAHKDLPEGWLEGSQDIVLATPELVIPDLTLVRPEFQSAVLL